MDFINESCCVRFGILLRSGLTRLYVLLSTACVGSRTRLILFGFLMDICTFGIKSVALGVSTATLLGRCFFGVVLINTLFSHRTPDLLVITEPGSDVRPPDHRSVLSNCFYVFCILICLSDVLGAL